jgi:hypothetical protein
MNRVMMVLAAVLTLFAATGLSAEQEVSVVGVRLAAGDGGAELTIQLSGPARYSDFTLADPARLVVDVEGARVELPRSRFEVARAGVAGIRSSQFAPGVVRIVVDLERAVRYSISTVPEGIRVDLGGSAGAAADHRHLPGCGHPRRARELRGVHRPLDRSRVGRIGTVTATIRDQPWDVALQTILRRVRARRPGAAERDHPGRRHRQAAGAPDAGAAGHADLPDQLRAGPELATSSLDPLRRSAAGSRSNPSTNTLIVTDVESVL